ncbi:MAG TPA: glycoside hydrolase family 15 [Actinomycetes bacterium]
MARNSPGGRSFAVAAPLCFVLLLGVANWLEPRVPPLRSAGIALSPGDGAPVQLGPHTRGRFLPGTSQLASGRVDAAAVAESRAWLAAGVVPGSTDAERQLAERALLDLRLLSTGGAAVASLRGYWRYVWPRDASWYAAAFAATGHPDEAFDVLDFLASVQRPDGTWAARYRPSGHPVDDGRRDQLDAVGWVPWAVWFVAETAETADDAPDRVAALWPAVRRAADVAARSLDGRGLPRKSYDYWETGRARASLGLAGPLLAGLRSAAAIARSRGATAEEHRWTAAAGRLARAVRRHYAAHGFTRAPDGAGGQDASVAWLAAPFGPRDAAVEAAVVRTAAALRTRTGGYVPGERFPGHRQVAWTPTTAALALAMAASGDAAAATRIVGWLGAHTTAVGSLPERVDQKGHPVAVAPLGWTDAAVLLTLVARDRGLPVPPVG